MKTFIFAALLLASPLAQADSWHSAKGMMCNPLKAEEIAKMTSKHQDKFMKGLKLSKEQQAKMDSINTANSTKLAPLMAEAHKAHEDFMAVLQKDGTREELKQSFANVQSKKQAIMNQKIEGMLDVRDALTPEQRKMAIEKISKKKEDLCD